ncbi:MAG: cytochrome c oxidase subunit II, partial [Acidobacteriota bacterium]
MNLFDFPLFPESASTFSGQVDALYFFSLAVSAFFSLLIAAAAIFLMVRYKRKHKDEVGAPIHGSLTLEIAWSFIPLVVTMVLFAWGAKVYFDTTTPPTDAREYFVTGKQWMWKAQHPEGQREINHLHVPVDTPIKLTMTSEDTIHSFYIPAFRIKRDVLPGRYTTVWFEATKTGTYHLFCAEYCGAEHSKMIGSVIVMEQDEYQNWLSGGLEAISPIASGEKLFEQYACNT